MNDFDKNNAESVVNAKNFIRQNYAGIIISYEYNIMILLMHSGELLVRQLPKFNKYPRPEKGYSFIEKIKENIQNQDRKGLLDGKFKELLDAFNFTDIYSKQKQGF